MDGDQWGNVLDHIVDKKNEEAVYNIVMPLYETSDHIIGVYRHTKENVIKQLSEIGEYKLVEYYSK